MLQNLAEDQDQDTTLRELKHQTNLQVKYKLHNNILFKLIRFN